MFFRFSRKDYRKLTYKEELRWNATSIIKAYFDIYQKRRSTQEKEDARLLGGQRINFARELGVFTSQKQKQMSYYQSFGRIKMTPKAKQHTKRIATFLTEEQLENLKAIAERKGLTVSALIRVFTLEGIEKNKEK
ncbi:hypothetical protein [Macellibacteroides fermentans]|uniref:hypothetical protein n=1 Tax=Macellibacteroides fermentans TaxID=879969 RepID=UPI00406C64B7